MIEMEYEPHLEEQLRRHPGRQADRDWAQLMEVVADLTRAIEAEQAAGTGAPDARMLELARQWRTLIDRFTGGERHRPATAARLRPVAALPDP